MVSSTQEPHGCQCDHAFTHDESEFASQHPHRGIPFYTNILFLFFALFHRRYRSTSHLQHFCSKAYSLIALVIIHLSIIALSTESFEYLSHTVVARLSTFGLGFLCHTSSTSTQTYYLNRFFSLAALLYHWVGILGFGPKVYPALWFVMFDDIRWFLLVLSQPATHKLIR